MTLQWNPTSLTNERLQQQKQQPQEIEQQQQVFTPAFVQYLI